MGAHVAAMLELQQRGAVTFDYGNNIRAQAVKAGVANAFDIPGFVPEYIRPLFCEGKGPFRWAALSGDPADIHATDRAALEMFADDEALCRWIRLAAERVAFQGLPARIFWLGYGERAAFGLRDQRDGPHAARSRRRSSSAAITSTPARWPRRTARPRACATAATRLPTGRSSTRCSTRRRAPRGCRSTTAAASASATRFTPAWSSSPTASREADEKLQRVLTCDPGIGVARHADAGYPEAIATAEAKGVRIPMREFGADADRRRAAGDDRLPVHRSQQRMRATLSRTTPASR